VLLMFAVLPNVNIRLGYYIKLTENVQITLETMRTSPSYDRK